LLDFFLDGVALDDNLMQDDGIHPNAAAQPKLLDNLWPVLAKVLKK
jgi:acyl-CoA thioesterase-1